MKCSKHPKFTGRKVPKHQCGACFSLYMALNNKPRVTPRPSRPMRDKSKYSRKTKHRKSW